MSDLAAERLRMRLFQAIEDQFPEADHELEPVESYLAYFRQLLLWQREASAPATEEAIARLNPLLRRQLSQLLQFSVLENDWYIVDTLVHPSIACLAGCVESQNRRYLLSPARLAVVERALALALTRPENQVQWEETTAAHWKRLPRPDWPGWEPAWSFDYLKRQRRSLTVYLNGAEERKSMFSPQGLAATLREMKLYIRHDKTRGWIVSPTSGPAAPDPFAEQVLVSLATVARRAMVADYLSGRDERVVYERRRDELAADGLLAYKPEKHHLLPRRT